MKQYENKIFYFHSVNYGFKFIIDVDVFDNDFKIITVNS